MNSILIDLEHAARELTEKVVVISAFLMKGDNNPGVQKYYAEELRNAVDKFNGIYWPAETRESTNE